MFSRVLLLTAYGKTLAHRVEEVVGAGAVEAPSKKRVKNVHLELGRPTKGLLCTLTCLSSKQKFLSVLN